MIEQKSAGILLEVSRQLNGVGAYELELAFKRTDLSKAQGFSNQVNLIKVSIHAFREPFVQGKILGTEGWNALYSEINEAAALELGRTVNDKITKLQAEHSAIGNAIDSERKALAAKHDEFDSLLTKAQNAKGQYAGYAGMRNDLASAEAEYEQLFENQCRGMRVNPQGFAILTEMISSRPIRLKVLAKLEAEAKAQIVSLQKRNKELAKELNLEPHSI
jgi:hypothetical protein